MITIAFPSGPVDGQTYTFQNKTWVYKSATSTWTLQTNLGGITHAATAKTSVADADEFGGADSAASYSTKKWTWTTIKAAIKSYLDTFYLNASNLSSGTVADARLPTTMAGKTFSTTVTVAGGADGSTTGNFISQYGLTASTALKDLTGNPAFMAQSQGTGATAGAAAMVFHRPNSFAAYFGLDTDNKWKVGGFSYGAFSYEVFNEYGVANATSKATPADADIFAILDSAASYVLKKSTWSNIKSTLKSYFDGIYQAALGYTPVQQGGGTGQNANKLYMGWDNAGHLLLQVDSTNYASTWPISISGNANTTTSLATSRNIDGQAFNGSADITVIAPGTHAATSKATPVDADELPLVDSAASNGLKKLTWANLKATIKSYLDTFYLNVSNFTSGNLNPLRLTYNNTNLLPNIKEWVSSGAATFTYQTDLSTLWGPHMAATASFSGASAAVCLSPFFRAQAGASYTVTGDSLLIFSGGSADCYFDLLFYASDGTTMLLDGGQSVVTTSHDFAESDSTRNTHAVTAVAPTGTAYAQARFVVDAGAGTTVTAAGFRRVKAERSAYATAYTQEGQLSNVDNTSDATKNAATVTLTNKTMGSGTVLGADVTGGDFALTRVMLKDAALKFYDSGTTNALDYTNGSHQRWAPATGAQTLSVANWPPTGNSGELLIEGVNLGASTITWPTVNWVKPDGTFTTSISTYLTAAGITLQSSGTDWVDLWTRDGGTTVYGMVGRG
jgi:hypothetical protein